MSEQIMMLRVVTTKECHFIAEDSKLDQEGTLIKFYKDGNIQLVVNTEDFLWCERVTR